MGSSRKNRPFKCPFLGKLISAGVHAGIFFSQPLPRKPLLAGQSPSFDCHISHPRNRSRKGFSNRDAAAKAGRRGGDCDAAPEAFPWHAWHFSSRFCGPVPFPPGMCPVFSRLACPARGTVTTWHLRSFPREFAILALPVLISVFILTGSGVYGGRRNIFMPLISQDFWNSTMFIYPTLPLN